MIPSLTGGAGDYVWDLAYNPVGDYFAMSIWDNSAGFYRTYVSNDDFATSTGKATVTSGGFVTSIPGPGSANDNWIYTQSSQAFFYTSFSDATSGGCGTAAAPVTGIAWEFLTGTGGSRMFMGNGNGNINTGSGGSTTLILDNVTFSDPINAFANSQSHDRTVCVGNAGTIGYISDALASTVDSWTAVANGFSPLADVKCVEFNESDGMFVACANNGQICRSSNGTN